MKTPDTFLRLGMTALLFASVLNFSASRTQGAAEPWIDGAMGLMYGLAIGLLLLSVRLKARRDGNACQ
jgi:hypothetical protein